MLNEDWLRLLRAMPETEETMPFGPGVLVFKLRGKMFATLSMEETPTRMNLKCSPTLALALRERYPWIVPGYHMNKKHWNTLKAEPTAARPLVKALIAHSWNRVRAGLPRKTRNELAIQPTPPSDGWVFPEEGE